MVADAAAQYTGQSDTAGSAGAEGYAVLGRAGKAPTATCHRRGVHASLHKLRNARD